MDCHNRPTQVFPTANSVEESAMAAGSLSTKLPAIKQVEVKAMTLLEIKTSGEDLQMLSAQGQEFKHPGGEFDPELTCSGRHNGGIQK